MMDECILMYVLYSWGFKKEGAHPHWGSGGHDEWEPLADEITSKLDLKECQCITLKCFLLHETLTI